MCDIIKISVIIPTYKPGKYLFECLDSVLNQSLDSCLYEVIVILNGPQYPFWQDLQKYVEDYPALYLFYIKEIGVSNARNYGLEKAKGDYVCFIDDDDLISENYLENLLKLSGTSQTIIVSNVYRFYENRNELIKDYLTITDRTISVLKNRRYLSNACCKLIPVSIIRNRKFDLKFSQGEDALFMFSISDKIKCINKVPDSIYYRQLRKKTASKRKKTLLSLLKTTLLLQCAFTVIYFNNPLKYNFLLYLSRLLAVLKR